MQLEELRELLDKVEASDIPDTGVDRFRAIPRDGGGVYADPNHYNARDSYWSGSLDAAKALHDAVLPRWVTRDSSHTYFGYECALTNSYFDVTSCSKFSKSRAHLIAIIKALIVEKNGVNNEPETQ